MFPAVNSLGYKTGHFLHRNWLFWYYFSFTVDKEIIHWRIEADNRSEDVLLGGCVSVLWYISTEAAILKRKVR